MIAQPSDCRCAVDGAVGATASPHHLYHPLCLALPLILPQALEGCLHAQPCKALLLGWAGCSNMIFWAECFLLCLSYPDF